MLEIFWYGLGAVFFVFLAFAASFGFISFILYMICLVFNFTFTWKLAVGVYFVLTSLGYIFKKNNN